MTADDGAPRRRPPSGPAAFPLAPDPRPTPDPADPYGRLVAFPSSWSWDGGVGREAALAVVEEGGAAGGAGPAPPSQPASARVCVPLTPADWPPAALLGGDPSASASSDSLPTLSSSSSSDGGGDHSDSDGDAGLRRTLTGKSASAPSPALPPAAARPWAAAAPLILSTEVASNLAYYSISVNLVVYLTEVLGRTPGAAAAQAHVWTGLSYVAPLAGGAIADAWLGRPLTILVAVAVYAVGLAALTAQAFLLPHAVRAGTDVAPAAPLPPGVHALFTVAMVCIAVGTGGVKPNVAAAGADQFGGRRVDAAAAARAKASFFNWYYFVINVGALLASTGIVYVQTEVDWAVGFGIPAAAAAAATLAFGGGYAARLYRGRPPRGSGLGSVCRVVGRGLAARWRRATRGAAAAAAPTKPARLPGAPDDDAAAGRRAAADARQLLAMAPVWVSLLGWNGAYATAGTVMVQQAGSCDLNVGALRVPPAAMFLCATLTLLALVPLYERVVLPALARRGRPPPSMLARTGAACATIAAAQFVAAGVEAARLRAAATGTPFSVLWLVPQYVLVGASEFCYVGAIEFWYAQAPPRLRSLGSALLLSAFGVANLLSGGVVKAVERGTDWMPTAGGGGGRLDLYFACLGAAATVNAALFAWPVAARYRYYTPPADDGDDCDTPWGSVAAESGAAEEGKGGGAAGGGGAAPLARPSPVRLALPLSTARLDPLTAWPPPRSRDPSLRGGRAFLSRAPSFASSAGGGGGGDHRTVHGGAAALAALRRAAGLTPRGTTPRGTPRGARLARAASAPDVGGLLGGREASDEGAGR